MEKKDFENLMKALQEVLEIERGERKPSKMFKMEYKKKSSWYWVGWSFRCFIIVLSAEILVTMFIFWLIQLLSN